jgi:hypothetical protein
MYQTSQNNFWSQSKILSNAYAHFFSCEDIVMFELLSLLYVIQFICMKKCLQMIHTDTHRYMLFLLHPFVDALHASKLLTQ